MDSKNSSNNEDIQITQLNEHKGFTDLEKTAILQFEMEENLSKTQQFVFKNNRASEIEEFDLPKKKPSLSDTIKLKISDLRKYIDDEDNLDLPKKKKSLYDTIIIKLDNLVNKKNAIKMLESKKVTDIEDTKLAKKQKKTNNVKKLANIKVNVSSEDFGKQLYNLNRIALINLSNQETKSRRYNGLYKLEHVDKVQISDDDYNKYQKKLNKFAINKLYYKLAPKETKKYKAYKYGVMLTMLVFIVTLFGILSWIAQGRNIAKLSYAINEQTIISNSYNGELYNVAEPTDEQKKDMYWRYLNTPLSSVEFDNLKEINEDTVAWLIVNGTNVNYPVVQTDDNEYYLSHAFDKSKNYAGWVYADFRDNFDNLNQNTVIYAHGRKDKVMFGSLMNALEENWYTNKDNQIIQLSTPQQDTMWQVFSVYKIPSETYYITTNFSSNESYNNFISVMKHRSIYDFGVDVNEKDKLLTLSTCYNENGIRMVIQAKLVKSQKRIS